MSVSYVQKEEQEDAVSLEDENGKHTYNDLFFTFQIKSLDNSATCND